MLSICLTGGPCGGKSSGISILTQALEARGYKTIVIEESATTLIMRGIIPGKNISLEDFQNFVLDEQLSKEDLCRKVSDYYNVNKIVLIHDRGICDQMAYIDRIHFEKMLKSRNMTLSDVYSRYDGVLHLVTAAKGTIEHYQWNDPTKDGVGNNSARSESPEEAIIKDDKTLEAWIGHPH